MGHALAALLLTSCRATPPTTPAHPVTDSPADTAAELQPPPADPETRELPLWQPTASDVPRLWALRTSRIYGLHVQVAMPAGATAVRSRTLGLNTITIEAGDITVTIKDDAGGSGSLINVTNLLQPDSRAGKPAKIQQTFENTTAYFEDRRVVVGRTHNARCYAEELSYEQAKTAFTICASLRVAPTGPLEAVEDELGRQVFTRAPREAIYNAVYDQLSLYTGHFKVAVSRRDCAVHDMSMRALAEPSKPSTGERTRELERASGPLLVHEIDEGLTTLVIVSARQEERCCVGWIFRADPARIDEQIEYVAQICDGVRPPTSSEPGPLD